MAATQLQNTTEASKDLLAKRKQKREALMNSWEKSIGSSKSILSSSIFTESKRLLHAILRIKNLNNFPSSYIGKPLIEIAFNLTRRELKSYFREAFSLEDKDPEKLKLVMKMYDVCLEIEDSIFDAIDIDTTLVIGESIIEEIVMTLGKLDTDIKKWATFLDKKMKGNNLNKSAS